MDKKLHKTASSFLQSVDYRYTIRGQLKSINNAQLDINSQNNDDTNDYFGMELLYDSVESGFNANAFYNGKLSAVKWKSEGGSTGTGTAGQRGYIFEYDGTDRLRRADFNAHGTTAWDQETGTLNEYMNYDHNGNILSLKRNHNVVGLGTDYTVTATPQMIDNLTYSYTLSSAASGNQLGKVQDASAITGGFADGSNTGDDYTYDSSGNIISDQNKGISSITYNILGKARQITFTDGRLITYTYDASGNKLRMTTTLNDTTTTITNYVDGFVYNNRTLNFFSSPEGRVVNNAGNNEYQYAIADNLGNTRLIFTSAAPVAQVSYAGFEDCCYVAEQSEFIWKEWERTNGGIAHSGTFASWMLGDIYSMMGPSNSYHVYSGDKVELSGYSYSEGTTTCCGSALGGFTGYLLAAFGVPAPAPGETGTAGSALSAIGAAVMGGYAYDTGDNTDAKVFFTILVFDKNYNLIDTKYQQVTDDETWQLIDLTYTAKEESYVYMYISNESAMMTSVLIDDITMTYTPSRVIQHNEYYPFGLQTAKSWTRQGTSGNQFLYNEGSELNSTTGFYDLPYRNYEASLGRFFQVDPLAHVTHNLTPYHYAGNNPISVNDPTGLLSDYVPLFDGHGNVTPITLGGEGMPEWSYDANSSSMIVDGGGGGGGTFTTATTNNSWNAFWQAIGKSAENADDGDVIFQASEDMAPDKNGQNGFWWDSGDALNSNATQGDYYNTGGEHIGELGQVGVKSVFIPIYDNMSASDWQAFAELDFNSVGENYFGDYYTGPNNPLDVTGQSNYYLKPKNIRDYYSMVHDQRYDAKGAKGPNDVFFNTEVAPADIDFARNQFESVSSGGGIQSFEAGVAIGFFGTIKTVEQAISGYLDHPNNALIW